MTKPALFVVLAAVAMVVPLAPPGTAHANEDLRIDVTKSYDDADTYMFTIRYHEGFNLLDGSVFKVRGHYPTNASAPVQDAGAMVGVIRFASQINCETQAGDDPCFMGVVGHSIKDAFDARLASSGPVAFDFELDANAAGHASFTSGVEFSGITSFQRADPSDDFVTIRYFVSVPGAERITVTIHFHSNKPITIRDEVAHDGGFLFVGDDYDAVVDADSLPAQAMAFGAAPYDFQRTSSTHRLYAAMGPSWYGTTVVVLGGGVAGTHNTAAVSQIGVEKPDGTFFGGTAFGIGGSGGPAVVGSTQEGTYRFIVDAHAGVGPQDIYTVGAAGPISG